MIDLVSIFLIVGFYGLVAWAIEYTEYDPYLANRRKAWKARWDWEADHGRKRR